MGGEGKGGEERGGEGKELVGVTLNFTILSSFVCRGRTWERGKR